MATELVRVETGEIQRPHGVGFSESQIDLIKTTICRGSSDDELQMFINQQAHGLDPFALEIYAIKGDSTNKEVMGSASIDDSHLIAELPANWSAWPDVVRSRWAMDGRMAFR